MSIVVFGTCPVSGQSSTKLVRHDGQYMSFQSKMMDKLESRAMKESDRSIESEKSRLDQGVVLE